MIRMLVTHTGGRAPLAGALLVLGLALVGCAGSDSDAEPVEAAEAGASEETTDDGSSAEDDSGTTGLLGTGEATVTVDGVEHTFASDGTEGRCEVLMGAALAVSMPIVTAAGVDMPEGSGELTLELPVEADDADVVNAYGELRVDGSGHWFAGASETASVTGVETPAMALTVDRDGGGITVTGTQPMVPLVSGSQPDIDAVMTVTCDG